MLLCKSLETSFSFLSRILFEFEKSFQKLKICFHSVDFFLSLFTLTSEFKRIPPKYKSSKLYLIENIIVVSKGALTLPETGNFIFLEPSSRE